MKCVVLIACGLAEEAREDLNGKTPLDVARTPVLDQMASRGILGLTRTVPRGVTPGCQSGALSLLGYDVEQYPIGAATLEALGVGATVAAGDVVLRANLVTLDATEDGTEILGDPLGGRLPVADAAEVARDLARALDAGALTFVPGLGHRHVVAWRGGERGVRTVSPYELVDKPLAGRRPSGPGSDVLADAMARATDVLARHPVCIARRARAERVPTTLWVWEPSTAATLPALRDAFGIDGVMVAATPIGRGLGIAVGLEPVTATGATGDVDSNLGAEVEAVLQSLAAHDLAVAHVAGADLAAHGGDPHRKIGAIERLDELFVGPLLEGLRRLGDDWRVLVAADHTTSCTTRAHGNEPVPFCVYTQRDEGKPRGQKRGFSERDAREQGIFIQEAHALLDRLVRH
jgi:2,3-bisphosphoglycerate-independent phosphoglycerate mutase